MNTKVINVFRHAFVSVAGNSAAARGSFGPKSRMALGGVMLASLALTACGGGGGGGGTSIPPGGNSGGTPTTYSIGGTVSGLSGTGLVLQNNGGDNLTVNSNGAFTFATKVNSGAAYAVTVATQPSGQTCTVATGSGTATANVTNVAVTCAATASTVTVGGTVSGLTGTGLVLQDNNGDDLPVASNGSFVFATATPYCSSVQISATHGAMQRLMSYSRQGRPRRPLMTSLQERNPNSRCDSTIVRRPSLAGRNGPA